MFKRGGVIGGVCFDPIQDLERFRAEQHPQLIRKAAATGRVQMKRR
jgi:hypothetical protein